MVVVVWGGESLLGVVRRTIGGAEDDHRRAACARCEARNTARKAFAGLHKQASAQACMHVRHTLSISACISRYPCAVKGAQKTRLAHPSAPLFSGSRRRALVVVLMLLLALLCARSSSLRDARHKDALYQLLDALSHVVLQGKPVVHLSWWCFSLLFPSPPCSCQHTATIY